MDKQTKVTFSSRYDALGIDISDTDKICDGLCEGTGVIPVKRDNSDPELRKRWREAHANAHSWSLIISLVILRLREGKFVWAVKTIKDGRKCDGHHVVTCPLCEGSGMKKEK